MKEQNRSPVIPFFTARAPFLQILAVLFLVLSVAAGCKTYAASSDILTLKIQGSFETTSARQMLENINDLRANDAWYWNSADTEKISVSGLVPLVYDYELERVAMQRAAELAVYYSHDRPNGEDCFTAYTERLTRGSCGENIAYGQTSANEVFTDWAEEFEKYEGQGHRRNMLNSRFRSVGVGCFECEGTLFWVQEFSSASTGASPDPLTAPVSINVLRQNITKAVLGKSRIDLVSGQSLALSDIGFFVVDAKSPHFTVPCEVSAGSFRTADPAVAGISNGMLVASGEGETTLTVSAFGLSVTVPVQVRESREIPLTPGKPVEVYIPAGEIVYFSFDPPETAVYTFASTGSYDTFGYLLDSNYNLLESNDDGGGAGYNFSLSCQLEEGSRYYFGASLYNKDESGTITVILTSNSESSDFTYMELNDGTLQITGCNIKGDVVIPDSIDGRTVTSIASQLFYEKVGITSVTLPASVTYFGNNRSDNDWDYVFSYCYDLENIFVDSRNPSFCSVDGVLYNKDKKTLINYPCNHSGEVYHVTAETGDILCCTSFAACQNLRFLFLDNPETWWYTYTFFSTGQLTTFYCEGGRTADKAAGEIEACAFQASAIKYLIVPDTCREIAAGAFAESELEYIQTGSSTAIAPGALDGSVVVEIR